MTATRTWLITGVGSGFGHALTTRLLERGDTVIGTVRALDKVADPIDAYEGNPAHAFRAMLDPAGGLAPGDPQRMAARIIESVDTEPAPLRMVLGSQALESTLGVRRKRIDGFETQRDLAASTDFPLGE
ncbi:hypothetical protein [Streptomyces ziwulingensis]|uniref:Uncharacterized protein n=1 Tax=Streptomyces ziwulingensis TaxID=1045501 RepID=A0ABP9CL57_9ACTN